VSGLRTFKPKNLKFLKTKVTKNLKTIFLKKSRFAILEQLPVLVSDIDVNILQDAQLSQKDRAAWCVNFGQT